MLLYEVQTRPLLHRLSIELGRPTTLSDLPDATLRQWRQLGFIHIWFMGIWPTAPQAREVALHYWKEHWQHEVPSTPEDVLGSPYAIDQYEPMGMTLAELAQFSDRVARHGLLPIYDFVPNHFGLGTRWAQSNPGLFIASGESRPGTVPVQTPDGLRHFAHGKDPYFPPWSDTLQVEYRLQANHELMCRVGEEFGNACPGLRCDMSMLVIDEIFQQNWKGFPSPVGPSAQGEFWRAFQSRVGRSDKSITIAEAYWDREQQLLEMGFDFVYNKRVYDFLVRRQPGELLNFLFSKPREFFERGLIFLENHDEPRAASLLSLREHKAAAFFMLAMPGLVLIHQGQLEGRRHFARIQLRRWVEEEANQEIASFYEELLRLRRESIPGNEGSKGRWAFVRLTGIGNSEAANSVLAIIWQLGVVTEVFIVNLSPNPFRGTVSLAEFDPSKGSNVKVLFRTDPFIASPRIQGGNLTWELPEQSGVCVRIGAA